MRTLIITALVVIGVFSTALYAQDQRGATPDKLRWLSIGEVHTRLESAGYRNIEKIERESGSYEVKATDRNGQRVKLYVHPQTGEVLERRQRDSKRDKYDSRSAKDNKQRYSADCNERRCRDDLPQAGAAQPAAPK